jgi:hypothetical protein
LLRHLCFIIPEPRHDAKGFLFLNQAAQMLAQCFLDHAGIALAAHRVAELPLAGAEGAFDVGCVRKCNENRSRLPLCQPELPVAAPVFVGVDLVTPVQQIAVGDLFGRAHAFRQHLWRCIVRSWIVLGLGMALSCLLALEAPTGDKPKPKPKDFVALDPAKAGPDWQVQGEYVGDIAEKGKLGAEVIARGDGNFVVNFLPGGLRGEGGDYSKHVAGTGKTESEKTTLKSKDGKWTADIVSGKMTGKTAEGQSFTLTKTTRKSKTLGMAPPKDAVVLFRDREDTEYLGEIAKQSKLGAEVSVKGDGTMQVTFLPGGLRGAGGEEGKQGSS